MRRRLKEPLLLKGTERAASQQVCDFVDSLEPRRVYEYVVLVTTLRDELCTLAQHYHDRADMENVFDELKNQWWWGRLHHEKDLTRCQLMSRQIALIYNWWSMFVRLAIPRRHAEAITSRPSLLMAAGTQTRHQGETTLTLTSAHAQTGQIQRALWGAASLFRRLSGNCGAVGVGLPLAKDAQSHFYGISARKTAESPTVIPSLNIIPQGTRGGTFYIGLADKSATR